MSREQQIVGKAMDAALDGMHGDAQLMRRIIQNEKGETMSMKKRCGLILALVILFIGGIAMATNVPGIQHFFSHVLDINSEAIVRPVTQSHDSEWLDIEVIEAYWSKEALHVVVKIDAENENQVICWWGEFKGSDPRSEYIHLSPDSEWVHVDEWRNGKEVLLIHDVHIKHDSGWIEHARREDTLIFETSSESMLMRADQLEKGIEFDIYVTTENLDNDEKEEATIKLKLPPMKMQSGFKWNQEN